MQSLLDSLGKAVIIPQINSKFEENINDLFWHGTEMHNGEE